MNLLRAHPRTGEVTVLWSLAEAQTTLHPEIAELDTSGRVMSTHALKVQQTIPVEIISMVGWLTGLAKENEEAGVKAVLRAAILQARDQYDTDLNIAIVRQGKDTYVKATQLIPPGNLAVPLFVRREGSMILWGSDTGGDLSTGSERKRFVAYYRG